MRTNRPKKKGAGEDLEPLPRPCRFLTPEEFADYRERNDWPGIERLYVRRKPGPAATGAAKSSTERSRELRRRHRG